MDARTVGRFLLRETRGSRGRLLFLVLCLAVGVAAVVSVAALSRALDERVRRDAKKILGGDLALSSTRELPPELQEAALAAGATTSRTGELVTMARIPDRRGAEEPAPSQLVELKVVDPGYPLYGEARTTDGEDLADVLASGGVVVGPELLSRFELEIGDGIRLGKATFPVRGVVAEEPDRGISAFQLGPRVFLSRKVFPATQLEAMGSRITRRLLLRLPGSPDLEAVDDLAETLNRTVGGSPHVRIRTWLDAQTSLGEGIRRVERFLGLVALLSLLVGGIGVAQTIRSFLASRLDALAILKCLGLRPREALLLYLGHCFLLGLAGSLLGGLAGLGVQQAAPRLLGDLLPISTLPFWQPEALARGLLLGLVTSLLFGIPPLTAVLRVPPLRALRRSAEPVPPSKTVVVGLGVLLIGGLFVLAAVQAGSPGLGARFILALLTTVFVLAGVAAGLRKLAGTLRSVRGPVWLRQGGALMASPGGDLLPALVALGLGVLVVLSTVLVQGQLSRALETELPEDAPTAFLLDVQPDQWEPIRSLLQERGAQAVDSVPVVMARITAVDGRSTEALAEESPNEEVEEGDRRWALTREQRLTYLRELPPDNELVAGSWFSPEVSDEISVEEEFARDLGAELGSTLTFDVQGIPLTLRVTSLRRVDWETFRINFFLVTEPEALAGAPQTRLAAARLPRGREQEIQDTLAVRFPNVTLIDVRSVLERVGAILGRLSTGIRALGLFTAAAGILILFGTVAAGSVRRSREVALLKTLGFTRGGVVGVFSTLFGLVGLVAGTIGAGGAVLLTWILVTQGFDLEWEPRLVPTALAVLGCVLLTLAAGLAASARPLSRRPLEILRSERE
ncbi:MAG: FtsX-like permease family protein [Thermoanaerobaculia bacterium]|nr:FtsX-like permease family protein [Thermoanaerobaculia bacterium]